MPSEPVPLDGVVSLVALEPPPDAACGEVSESVPGSVRFSVFPVKVDSKSYWTAAVSMNSCRCSLKKLLQSVPP